MSSYGNRRFEYLKQIQPQHNRSNLSFLFIFSLVDSNHEQNKWFKLIQKKCFFKTTLLWQLRNTKLSLGSTQVLVIVLVLGNQHATYKSTLFVPTYIYRNIFQYMEIIHWLLSKFYARCTVDWNAHQVRCARRLPFSWYPYNAPILWCNFNKIKIFQW